jgi:hypothetical protein
LTVAPALIVTAFLLAGFPLLAIGWFRPVPVIVLSVLVAAVLVPLGLTRLPGLLPGPTVPDLRLWAQPGDPAGTRDSRRTPWWPLVALLVITLGFLAFQAAYHGQFLIISRDPGTYMQFAAWIEGHGKLPIQLNIQDFGGAKGIYFQGFAMYQVGNTLTPQFMAGLPMALAAGWWVGGVNGALLLSPVFGALALVAFGGLAARLVGTRWAPLAVLALALSEPQMMVSRSTYSEPLTQILFFGGLSLLLDAQRSRHAPGKAAGGTGLLARAVKRLPGTQWDSGRVLGLLAGLALGISLLVRIDAPADMLALIPYLALMWLRGERPAKPIIIGLAIGWVYGWYDAIFLSFPYVFQTNKTSSELMIALLVATLVITVIGAWWLRRRLRADKGLPQVGEHWYLPGWLPKAAAVAPFVVLAAFYARPHVQHVTTGLSRDPLSLHWVDWYIGGPAIVLGGIGAALLGYGCLRGRWPSWALPLMIFASSIVLVLLKPGITGDQPWASRRLVPTVLPGFILFGTWALAWACGKISRGEVRLGARLAALASWLNGRHRVLIAAAVAAVCGLLVIVPTAQATSQVALKRTYAGQVGAIYGLCDQLPKDASVVIINGPAADRIGQVIRGMCNVPVTRYPDNANVYMYPTASTPLVQNAIASIKAIGRTPVLLAGQKSELAPWASEGTITHAMNLNSTMDARSWWSAPTSIRPEKLSIWMWEPTR